MVAWRFFGCAFTEDLSVPRRLRITLPGVALHLIQRGNDRQVCLFADEDFPAYLGWLEEYAKESDCAIQT
jgi:putative transposase